MKFKILTILIIAFLLFSGIGVTAVNLENNNEQSFSSKLMFSKKTITYDGEYFSIDLDNTNSFLMDSGKPMLPSYTKTFTFPMGTKIKNVECTISSDVNREIIYGKIEPTPEAVSMILQNKLGLNDSETEIVEDASVYASSNLYPDRWYDYSIGCGLDGDERAIFLTVSLYPLRYSPAENVIYNANDVDVEITFEKPMNTAKATDNYDMVIIAPKKFSTKLQTLIKHKNNIGVSTVLKTTEDIYGNYEGRDEPEQIKYFIKDAIENWGVKYVLLAGGRKGQKNSWYVPVRYANLEDIDWYFNETSYISDLYYADVYKYSESSDGQEFDSWDSNGNGIFAEWKDGSHFPEDELDLYPDVIVGRLACRDIFELDIMIKKIIKYETSASSQDWFKKMMVFGGDTFPNDDNEYEGELETDLSSSYMQAIGFDITKFWVSNGALKSQRDVIRAISQGAGFMHFAGHGTPIVWSTHPVHSEDWLDGLYNSAMYRLRNRNKLPVIVVGGCHNSQFDVALSNFIRDLKKEGKNFFSIGENTQLGAFWRYTWVPECWSWKIVTKRNGGAIATIGNTGLRYGYPGNYTLKGLQGWIQPRFFYEIAVSGKKTLGEAHSQAITDYANNFRVHTDRIDCKVIQEWTLLGDPSLKISD